MTKSLLNPRQPAHPGDHQRSLVLHEPANAETPVSDPAIRVLVAHGDRLARAGLGALAGFPAALQDRDRIAAVEDRRGGEHCHDRRFSLVHQP